MRFFKHISGAGMTETLSRLIAHRLVRFGKRFGYILILTEETPDTGEPMFHMTYNGYGKQDSEQANSAAAELLELAAKIMRGKIPGAAPSPEEPI